MASCTAAVSSGRRAPNEKNTCRPGCGRQRGHRAGQEQLRAGHRVGRVGGDHVEAAGQAPRAAAGAGRARPAPRGPRLRAGLLADPGQHVGVGVDHGQPADHRRRARSRRRRPRSPPRSGRRRRAAGSAGRPARARRACRSTRRSLVATVQCVWSSSGRAAGAAGGRLLQLGRQRRQLPCRDHHAAARAVRAGRRPGPGWPAGDRRPARRGQPRPAGCLSTTPRWRSSLQAAATMGTGSSASRLISRTAAGSAVSSGGQDVPDPGLALGQPDRRRDLGHDCIQIQRVYRHLRRQSDRSPPCCRH